MAVMDLFSVLPLQVNIFPVYLNTGTLLDLACGACEENGEHYLVNGGLPNITGIGGYSQTFKSFMMDTFISRSMSIYYNVQGMIFDSENSKMGVERYDVLAIDGQRPSERLRLYDTTTDDLNTIHEKIKAIVDHKKKYAKDLMVETPFIDKDGKHIRMMIPTIVDIDSFSAAEVLSETEAIGSNELDSSDLNTIWMKSGRNKTLFMRQIVQYARSANIYFILSAHLGENKSIGGNPYAQPKKQLQHMDQNDKLKNVGAQFIFLTNAYFQTRDVKLLKEDGSSGMCIYPKEGFNNPNELNKVNVKIQRNKINASGLIVPFVISQYEGLINNITYLNYLREQKEDQLIKRSGGNLSCSLYPHGSFTRNNVRDKCVADYKLERALELAAQFIFVKNCWSPNKIPVPCDYGVERFVEFLNKDSGMLDDILQSRGYWSYLPIDRPYLTIFDVMDMVGHDKKWKAPTHHDMSPQTESKTQSKKTPKDKDTVPTTATATAA